MQHFPPVLIPLPAMPAVTKGLLCRYLPKSDKIADDKFNMVPDSTAPLAAVGVICYKKCISAVEKVREVEVS